MRFQGVSLRTSVGSLLELEDPLWVASSHHTTNDAAINAWHDIHPAALTLKTSKKAPPIEGEKEQIRFLLYPAQPRFGKSLYCDGPKSKELLDYETTGKLLKHACATLPRTRVGVSIVSDEEEDYAEHRKVCEEAAFCELNLKYSFRLRMAGESSYLTAATEQFQKVLVQVNRFCKAYHDKPVFIKIPREFTWLAGSQELLSLLDVLRDHGKAGVILANSQKLDLPSFIDDGRERNLKGGVICGETLFDTTIKMIADFRAPCDERHIPIVASGGMITEQHILHAFFAGASAVQLCTTFDYNRRSFCETLRSALIARTYMQGLRTLKDYIERLATAGAASIEAVPFKYFSRFWSDEVQNHIMDDVRRSEIMEVVVMSGYTLVEKWREVLKHRFSANRGLRLLLPNPRSDVFKGIQKSWGIAEGASLEARVSRVLDAAKQYRALWEDTAKDRKKSVKEGQKGTPTDDGVSEATFELLHHDQCPFYSCYLFDDNVYIAPYVFVRPNELTTPVYVFFRGSPEYDRIQGEVDGLRKLALQTQELGTSS